MGSSKEQGISTNNCKDKGSKTLTNVKTKLDNINNCKDQGSTTIKAKDQQITVNTKDPQHM